MPVLLALLCTYGIELLEDNIAECRTNMLEVRAASYVLSLNIVHSDGLKMRTSDNQPITLRRRTRGPGVSSHRIYDLAGRMFS